MGSAVYTDLLNNVDAGIQESFQNAAAGMTGYVMPVAWAAVGVTLMVWAILILDGKISSPMKGWFKQGITLVFILQAASTMYASWISGPLFQLPNDLSAAIAGATAGATALDALTTSLDQLMIGLAQAMVSAFGDWNFGGAIILFACMIAIALAGALLQIACIFNMLYAKLGLAMVLGVGPFFVICLMWQPIKGLFFSWLNTVMYFVFLSVMATMIMTLFVKIASRLMGKLEEAIAGSSSGGGGFADNIANLYKAMMSGDPAAGAVAVEPTMNILSVAFQIVLVFLPMFLVALELRTMVSSMTGGSGGSFGSGVMNAVNQIMRMNRASK